MTEDALFVDETRALSPRAKLDRALQLMDYAINHSLPVSKQTITLLEKARANALEPYSNQNGDAAIEIDIALRDLTAVTFPTTIDTLFASASRTPKLLGIALVLALIALLALASYSFAKTASLRQPTAQSSRVSVAPSRSAVFDLDVMNAKMYSAEAGDTKSTLKVDVWQSLLAISLGGLGALFYIAYNLIGVLSEKAFDAGDWMTHVIRFALGMAIGWILNYTIATVSSNPFMLLLPFLAGFSTRLVVGIINQAIQAIELTLGLDSKSAELSRRRNQKNNQAARGSTS